MSVDVLTASSNAEFYTSFEENSVFEEYNSEINGSYSKTVKFYPNVYGNSYESFIPNIFAVYMPEQKRFGIFRIKLVSEKFKVENYVVNRHEPFYLDVLDDPYYCSGDSYIVPSIGGNFKISFANAWLCKRVSYTELHATIPVMNVSSTYGQFLYSSLSSHKVFTHNSIKTKVTNYINKFHTTSQMSLLIAHSDSKKIPFDIIVIHNQYTGETDDKYNYIKKVPEYISDVIIKHAIENGETCPITMEPLEKSTTVVTSCFHFFEKSAIETWLNNKSNGSKCPVCKQKCII